MTEDQAATWYAFYRMALEGQRHTEEISVLFDTNASTEYEVSFNPILADDKQITGVSVFARDITERKKAELALRASEANLSALIENTDDIIYSLDQSYRLVTANSSFAHVLTELGADPTAKELHDIGPVAFGQSWTTLYERAFMGEKFHEELPVSLGGAQRAIEASFNPILTKERAVTGISVMARDITERKRAEDELKRTNFELDSFVYRASHDLRAPLRSVLGLVNLIKVEKDEKQRSTYLGLAEKSINKLDTFISDLTHFSRNTRLEVVTSEIDFAALLAECLENLRYMEKADRVKPIFEIETAGPFYSDPQRIAIIFQNLVSNAIKYQRGDVESFVRVAIETDEKGGKIIIEDNGKGIHQEYLSRIFEMFFRASEDSYGSGLGLYITAQVIEKLGGTIQVSSVYGEGTRFVITLPNAPQPTLADEQTDSPPQD
jgi:PAS domain S-box-containing protein